MGPKESSTESSTVFTISDQDFLPIKIFSPVMSAAAEALEFSSTLAVAVVVAAAAARASAAVADEEAEEGEERDEET